ncbi:MAG: TraX family protein [Oscillospiraceae bacterium]
MTSTVLKIIALATMVFDHVGAVFFPEVEWIRMVGRISFPLFAFLLVQGFVKTRSRPKYMVRLAVFALLSEVPYDLLFSRTYLNWHSQSIMLELFCGFCMLQFVESAIQKKNPAWLLGAAAMAGAAQFLSASYGLYGMALLLAFYLFRHYRGADALALLGLTYLFYGVTNFGVSVGDYHFMLLSKNTLQLFAMAASVPLVFYNGKKGRHSMKWLFYFVYPLHLLLLWVIRYFLEENRLPW